MSKRQEKIERRRAEQQAFLTARADYNMARFIQSNELGKQFFEQSKDKLSEQEIALLEAQLAENQKVIDEYLAKKEERDAQSVQKTQGLQVSESSS